jgi:membrane protease YdiL (CAAX protease family)
VIDLEWPVVAYVALLAVIGYGPSVGWCWFTSRRWASGHTARDLGWIPRWSDLGWGPVIWFAAILGQVAVGALVLGLDIPITNNTDGVGEFQTDRTYVISLVVTAVVAAPIVEELVFRGVVLRGLRSVTPAVAAIVLQGVLFGAAHLDPVRGAGNVGLVMVLSGVGIVLGAAAYLLRRIGPSIVAHAIFNGVVLALLLSGVADDLAEGVLAGPG